MTICVCIFFILHTHHPHFNIIYITYAQCNFQHTLCLLSTTCLPLNLYNFFSNPAFDLMISPVKKGIHVEKIKINSSVIDVDL